MNTARIGSALVLSSALMLGANAHAADGAAVYAEKCGACHGADGNAPIMATYPKIGDMGSDAILTAIEEYRSGARSGGTAMVMKGIVDKLSAEEAEAVAAYLES